MTRKRASRPNAKLRGDPYTPASEDYARRSSTNERDYGGGTVIVTAGEPLPGY